MLSLIGNSYLMRISGIKRPARVLSALAVCAVILLSGCGQTDVPFDDYFPLEPGVHWEYQRTEIRGTERKVSRFVVDNLDRRIIPELGDELATVPVTVRHTSDGTDYYLYADNTGVYRAGHRTLIEYYANPDPQPRLVLPAVDEFERGVSWNQTSRPYLLHSVQSHVAWNGSGNDITLSWEVITDDESVQVPAGKFEHCLRIEGRTTLGLYADPRLGYQEVPVSQVEWYAPGVGLVKLVRDEPLDLDMFKGGSLVMELVRFEN
jgi:hypothetical protein